MDLGRFLDRLPGLYEDWGRSSVRPRTDRFGPILQRVRGMTTANVLQLLNEAVACLEGEEVYGEVGCFQGATLIGALLGHAGRVAYAVDRFSEFDQQGDNHRILLANLDAFTLRGQVRFHRQDFEECLLDLRPDGVQFGVYLYDAAHDYRSTLMGLLLAVPLLAERALIVLDDSNGAPVKQAAWDFLAARPEGRLLLDLPTPGNGDPSFWNGVYVLGWDRHSHNACDSATLRKARQPALLQALYELRERA